MCQEFICSAVEYTSRDASITPTTNYSKSAGSGKSAVYIGRAGVQVERCSDARLASFPPCSFGPTTIGQLHQNDSFSLVTPIQRHNIACTCNTTEV
jgi:hypothetical protein